ncbi:hypothetical protein Dimus_032070, partial [Dionaea muscipula]
GCNDIGITTNGQAYFLLDLEAGAMNDLPLAHGDLVSTTARSHSLTVIGHIMSIEEHMSNPTDAAALAQREREISAPISARLDAEKAGGSGVNQEAEGVIGGGRDTASQPMGSANKEGRVDIPLHDEAMDNDL